MPKLISNKYNIELDNIEILVLPPSIITFTDHLNSLSSIEKFNEMMKLFRSRNCYSLRYNGYMTLSLYIKDMIENDQTFLSYTLENNILSFMTVYKKKIINGENCFINFNNKYEDFALGWMVYEYH
jgi:hypothetical protein